MNLNIFQNQESWIITFLASFLIWFMFAGFFLLWFFHDKIHRRHVVRALAISFVVWGVSQLIKSFFPTLRPFEANGTLPLTVTIPTDPAFPSAHTSTAFALATSVGRRDKTIGLLFVVFAVLVGLGRVLGNVHYFTDVVAGAVLGVMSVGVFEKIRVTSLFRKK